MPKLSLVKLEAASAGLGLDGCVDPTLVGVFDTQQLLSLFRPPSSHDGGGESEAGGGSSSSALPRLDLRGALFEELAGSEFEVLHDRVESLRDEYFAIKASVAAASSARSAAPPPTA